MGKLKNAVIEARELAETRETNEALLWQARKACRMQSTIQSPMKAW
jgi:hypothetical protein